MVKYIKLCSLAHGSGAHLGSNTFQFQLQIRDEKRNTNTNTNTNTVHACISNTSINTFALLNISKV